MTIRTTERLARVAEEIVELKGDYDPRVIMTGLTHMTDEVAVELIETLHIAVENTPAYKLIELRKKVTEWLTVGTSIVAELDAIVDEVATYTDCVSSGSSWLLNKLPPRPKVEVKVGEDYSEDIDTIRGAMETMDPAKEVANAITEETVNSIPAPEDIGLPEDPEIEACFEDMPKSWAASNHGPIVEVHPQMIDTVADVLHRDI